MGRKRPNGWPAFDRDTLIVLAEVGRMFGKWPHEVMELNPYQLGLCVQAWRTREQLQERTVESMAAKGLPVFPAVIMKG